MAPARDERELVLEQLREAYRQAQLGKHAIERARTVTTADLHEAFLMDAEDRARRTMEAIEAAAGLVRKK